MVIKRYRNMLAAAGLAAAILAGTTACGSRSGTDQGLAGKQVHSAKIIIESNAVRNGVHALSNEAGTVWFPLEDLSDSLGYRTMQQDGKYLIGGTDAAYTVRLNDKMAYFGDTQVQLPDPPTLVDGKPYVSTEAFSKLMGMPVRWESDRSQLVITPSASGAGDILQTPVGSADGGTVSDSAVGGSSAIRSLGAGSANPQELVVFAKKFLGTPYQFSSGPYEQTGTFDCSSYMRYIFRHVGIELPRSSIQQSNVGTTVKDGNMQPGDLMFFYTPGRYNTNNIVGHVGMYIGDNKFINTWGAPGVVISNLNAYWKHRLLFAKRVM